MRSVLDQEYPNLEYMIIDGGSGDGSVEIIRRYERRLKWWVSEPDRGQSHAINKGFCRATGDIIAWLNSDDLLVPGALECVAQCFDGQPDVDLIYGDAEIIDAAGEPIMHRKELPFDRLMGMMIGFGFLIPQPAAFWRRRVLESVGLLDERLHYAMDSDYWRRIAERHIIRHVPVLLARMRYHPGAKTVRSLKGQAARAYDEWRAELRTSWTKLPIHRLIPYGFSEPIRRVYRLRRIFLRGIRGHYFRGYRAAWRFR